MNCDPILRICGITDARCCLFFINIAFVIKMVNKENVKNYLNRRQG